MKSNNVKMQAWSCPRAFQKVQERRSESEPERVTKSKFTECLILDLPFGGGFMSALNLPLTVNFHFSLPVLFDTGASSWAQCSCFAFHAAGV
jgi:hypothetical protein